MVSIMLGEVAVRCNAHGREFVCAELGSSRRRRGGVDVAAAVRESVPGTRGTEPTVEPGVRTSHGISRAQVP